MSPPLRTHVWTRIALLSLCAVTAAQAAWIVLAELHHPRTIQLAANPRAALAARDDRGEAERAASLAIVRGALWAESAFTYANLLWTDATGPDQTSDLDGKARASLQRALAYSPHRGDAWLMLAALADRYRWPGSRPAEWLKMSYYTAPNEQALAARRLALAFRLPGIEDPDLADMVRRDLRMILADSPGAHSVVLAAYRNASPANKAVAERLVSEVDPAYARSLRAEPH